MINSPIIYTVTVIDDSDEEQAPYQRIPGIFTTLDRAISAIKNNDSDIAESGTCRYAVIEQTELDQILPNIKRRVWFKWDVTEEAYASIETPTKFERVRSFGIN